MNYTDKDRLHRELLLINREEQFDKYSDFTDRLEQLADDLYQLRSDMVWQFEDQERELNFVDFKFNTNEARLTAIENLLKKIREHIKGL